MFTRTSTHKGFTLIELIVTIVILGILAALAVPAFTAVLDRVRDNSVANAANGVARSLHALAASDMLDPDADWADQLAAMNDADPSDLPTSLTVVLADTANDLAVSNDHGCVVVDLRDIARAGDLSNPATGSDVERDVAASADGCGDGDGSLTAGTTSDEDTSGLIYHLGTDVAGSAEFTSPHNAGIAVASLSTTWDMNNDARNAVNRIHAANTSDDGVFTQNEANSWWQLHLPNHTIAVSEYAIRSRTADPSGAGYEIRSWELQGSANGTDWTTLHTQSDDGTPEFSSWTAKLPADSSTSWSYLRVLQTGPNASGTNHLMFGEIEFWGTLTAE